MIYYHMYIADSDIIVCSVFLALRSTPIVVIGVRYKPMEMAIIIFLAALCHKSRMGGILKEDFLQLMRVRNLGISDSMQSRD